MSRYKNSRSQEELVKRESHIEIFIKKLYDSTNYKVREIKNDIKFIDKILEINNKIFVFRFTTSSHCVEISNNAKYWKVRSDLCKATTTFRKNRNPLLYVPSSFEKIVSKAIKLFSMFFQY